MSGGASGTDGEAKLLKLGLEPASERRRVMAVVTKAEETPRLMNWFQVRMYIKQRPIRDWVLYDLGVTIVLAEMFLTGTAAPNL